MYQCMLRTVLLQFPFANEGHPFVFSFSRTCAVAHTDRFRDCSLTNCQRLPHIAGHLCVVASFEYCPR